MPNIDPTHPTHGSSPYNPFGAEPPNEIKAARNWLETYASNQAGFIVHVEETLPLLRDNLQKIIDYLRDQGDTGNAQFVQDLYDKCKSLASGDFSYKNQTTLPAISEMWKNIFAAVDAALPRLDQIIS